MTCATMNFTSDKIGSTSLKFFAKLKNNIPKIGKFLLQFPFRFETKTV
jgi:hypothetical protein